MRESLKVNGLLDVAVVMAEGNPGAANVIADLLKDQWEDGLMKLLALDDMNIRGSQLWVGYKDHCGQDIEKFRQAISARDGEMIATINKECYLPNAPFNGYKEEAVQHGASFKRD